MHASSMEMRLEIRVLNGGVSWNGKVGLGCCQHRKRAKHVGKRVPG